METSYTITRYKATKLPEQYRNFVLATWLRSLRFGAEWFKRIYSNVYYKDYQEIIKDILDKEDCMIKIATLTDDRDVTLGYSVYRGDILDYMFVKKDHRKLGIADSLLPKGIKQISHITKTGVIIWEKKYGHWIFNPFC